MYRGGEKVKLYIKATTDRYELPLVVEDSPTKYKKSPGEKPGQKVRRVLQGVRPVIPVSS